MIISKMTLTDLEELSPMLIKDFDDFWSISILESELKNENSNYFIVRDNCQIIAFGGFWESVDDVHLTNIVVKKTCRNKGVGSFLLEELIKQARLTKKQSFTLEVNENNTNAKKLYLKYGFKIVGMRKNYYNNQDNALIMTLNFN